MADSYPTEKLLSKVINDLSDFLPYLVLVGGWIPYLYKQYVWLDDLKKELESAKPGSEPFHPIVNATMPLLTTDMDFGAGVPFVTYSGDESIADRIQKLGYGERHVSMDRMRPFVPIAKGADGHEKAEVEFITVPEPPEDLHEKLVGTAIKLNKLENFGILLENTRKISVFSHEFQIPTEAAFVFHKLITFVLRENENKRRKDLYYAYYMLRFCPNKGKLVTEIKALIDKLNEGESVRQNIEFFFKSKDDKGPVAIEHEAGTDQFIRNIRTDAFERITQLVA